MQPIKGQMFRYSEADMEAAIQECRRGVPTSTAAKKFGVPRVTLLNKVKGKTPIKRKMGRTCYISDDTEANFWPTPKQNSKRRRKEKVPSVVSSLEWQRYHVNKNKKRTELEEEKKRRAEEREKKKEETEKARKLKTDKKLAMKSKNIIKNKLEKIYYNSSTTEEEWVESGDSVDDISDEVTDEENEEERNEEEIKIKQGDYVIVQFPGKKKYYKYVCIVQKVTETEIEVMAMVACDKSKTIFKENDRDISVITESQIIKILDVPNMIITGDRIKYEFDCALEVDG